MGGDGLRRVPESFPFPGRGSTSVPKVARNFKHDDLEDTLQRHTITSETTKSLLQTSNPHRYLPGFKPRYSEGRMKKRAEKDREKSEEMRTVVKSVQNI
jgi:hypothetical protein